MQDVAHTYEYSNSHRTPQRGDEESGNENDPGFVVKGGPWEQSPQSAPNTASVEEFPSFGGFTPVAAANPDGAWGKR